MEEAPFVAKDMSLSAQRFLYACAFWAVAADENIKPKEQEWLISQFGKEGATESLETFVALESPAFFKAFDDAADSLSDEEYASITPRLADWLVSCAESDGGQAPEEKRVIEKILERLDARSGSGPEVVETGDPVEVAVSAARAIGDERLLEGHLDEVIRVRVSADGQRVLTASSDGDAKLWDFSKGTELLSAGGHAMGVTCIAFRPDGEGFVSGDGLGSLRMWNGRGSEPVWTWKGKRAGGLTGLDVSRDARWVVAVSDTGLIRIHAADGGREKYVVNRRKEGALGCVSFHPTGGMFATGGDDGAIRLWDTPSGRNLKTLEGHGSGVLDLRFSPEGDRLISASRDNTVRLWSVADASLLKTLEGHSFSVHGVAFSPDGQRAASCAWDHHVRIWDLASGEGLWDMESIDARFSGVDFHPDGHHVLAAGSDKTVHVVALK